MKGNAMKTIVVGCLSFFLLWGVEQTVFSHCEIPCGIYGDELRVELISENIKTIEKSMKKIEELSKETEKNYNQIVRWVNNKEEHASKIQQIVTQYFLNQRVKVVEEKEEEAFKTYNAKLRLLHGMLVSAMKAKQSFDRGHVQKLNSLLKDFKAIYFKAAHKHGKN